MLTVHHLSKSFNIEPLLKDISFSLNTGERLALVGPNGCGKTTLLRILVGQEKADSGALIFDPPGLQIGYLPQGLQPDPAETLGSFLAVDPGDPQGAQEEAALAQQLERLASQMGAAAATVADPSQPDLQSQYDLTLRRLERASKDAWRRPAVLASLGLEGLPLDTPVSVLSGGQKTRLALVRALLSFPQLLLLDEPTNHLDLDMLAWLEGWLTGPAVNDSTGVLLVSHDRAFLDNVATGILEIDPAAHTLQAYAGNYSGYLEAKLAERQRQWQSYTDQQDEIQRLSAAAAHMRGLAHFRKGGKTDRGDKLAKAFFANRSKGTVARAKHIEARLERLTTDEKIDKPRQGWQMKLEFGQAAESSRNVLSMEGLAVGYGDHVLLHDLDLHLAYGERLALVGPNGSGKTTLLRTIAGRIPPLAGSLRLGPSVRLGYMAQEQETLDPTADVLTALRKAAPLNDTDARTFLHKFLFSGDEVFTPVAKLSYGERARLMLACLVAQGCNFLMLDEPINHLDIPSRARFEQALEDFEGTILAVVHDRYFIEGFATQVWEVREAGIHIL